MRLPSLMVLMVSFALVGCAQQAVTPPQEAGNTAEIIDSENREISPIQVENPSNKPTKVSAPVCDCDAVETNTIAVIGAVEYVDILPQALRQKARIDTGAETTSLGARDIIQYESDGRNWVKFTIRHRDTGVETVFKKPLVRTASIKRHGAEDTKRPVVKVKLAIGEVQASVEVTLADREKFTYPVLIGRNFLSGRTLVDVNHEYMELDR